MKRFYLLLSILFLYSFTSISLAGIIGKKKKKTDVAEDTSTYKIYQDTTHYNGKMEVHADTIFNKKYEFKKIIVATEKVADTTWQDANVFAVNYRTINYYDYVPTDPAYGYTGKIKLNKPYSFFRPSEVLNKSRVGLVAGFEGGIYAIANVWWSSAWYSKTERTKFHFFNDNSEWQQMDKCGHTFTNYQVSRVMMQAMDWAGYSTKKQILIGTDNPIF